MNEAALAAALRMIGQGFTNLADALADVLEADVDEAVAGKQQREVTQTRAGRSPEKGDDPRVVSIHAAKEQKPIPAPADKEGYSAAALKALGKLDLAEATRPELKEVAEALGVYQQGQKASELRDLLGGILAKQQPTAKGGKKAAAPVVADDDEEPTYPDVKTMKKEFKLFCKVNRAAIEEENEEFFNDDEDSDTPEERLHQILADEDLLKTAWRDNVWDTKQRGEWDDLLKEAEAQVG